MRSESLELEDERAELVKRMCRAEEKKVLCA